jgi:hypothetical protein
LTGRGALRIASAIFNLAATLFFVGVLAAALPADERDPFRRACKPRRARR